VSLSIGEQAIINAGTFKELDGAFSSPGDLLD